MSQYNDGYYILSNNYATFEAQSMTKLSKTEAEVKKSVAYNTKNVYLIISLWEKSFLIVLNNANTP